jgi:hypothetical protein
LPKIQDFDIWLKNFCLALVTSHQYKGNKPQYSCKEHLRLHIVNDQIYLHKVIGIGAGEHNVYALSQSAQTSRLLALHGGVALKLAVFQAGSDG